MTSKVISKTNFRVRPYLAPGVHKVIFVFTAMGTKIGLYKPFVVRMRRRGYACIVYDYPLRLVLDGDLKEWEAFYTDIIADAQERLKALQADAATHFYACGVSMGTLIAQKMTHETPEISHVVLNLAYGDVAQNLWTYHRVKRAKKAFIKQGIDEAALRGHVRHVDPIVHAPKLRDKKVLLFLSRKDQVLVYKQTLATKRAFEASIPHLQYQENKYLGHYLGGAKNMLDVATIDDFFSS